ncbi:FG-GAP repeat domain-containing protein [Pseudophaeobacter sp.]|uniref:FG-GAP repeat domain-containing protein n=1 Tax=Pseudophaeobacter sp. TaxID=1971739 RepID=UPI00405A2D49
MTAGTKARRHLLRPWSRFARRAALAVMLLVDLAAAWPLAAEIRAVEFAEPTTRYPHGVLGDSVEYGSLLIHWRNTNDKRLRYDAVARQGTTVVSLPQSRVFEDLAPRLVDLDGDGRSEVLVVESDARLGAQLAIYDQSGDKIAATPPIGTRFRWLAPIGAADLDGDGHVEIAYIDRPHLAKTLRIWRFEAGKLSQVASATGLTNHRIGEDFITSGLRDCGQGPELITVDANWQRLVASRLIAGQIQSHDIGAFEGSTSLQRALGC